MNLYDVQEKDSPDRPVLDLVNAFFADLGAGRLDAARARTQAFSWFGTAVSDARWAGPEIRKFVSEQPVSAKNARAVSQLLLEAMLPIVRDDAFGPLADGERVVLVDVTRAGKTSTAFVVTAADKVLRVGDPERFIAFAKIAASC